MRVAVVEHDPECPVGLLGGWLTDVGAELDVRRMRAGDPLPAPGEHDGLVVLGGPMGAHDDDRHPWLEPTKALVRGAVSRDQPTLGICLGHQLIAVALGGEVHRNPRGQQVGLLALGWTAAAAEDRLVGPLATPRRGVHWNHDIVLREPVDAVALARTPEGDLQVARFSPTTWGVQLHPEVDAELLGPWASSDRAEHDELGIDQDAIMGEIEDARQELAESWRPLASAFVQVLR